jgi:hypothetical protein
VQVARCDCRVLVTRDPLKQVQLDSGVGHPRPRGVPQSVPHRPASPSSATNLSQPVASLSVAVVITPPRGPLTSRSWLWRQLVRRPRVGRTGSMTGTTRRRRPLGLLGHETTAARVGSAARHGAVHSRGRRRRRAIRRPRRSASPWSRGS